MKLDEFAASAFAVLQVSPRTKKNYYDAYRRYIASHLGHYEISQIKRSDVLAVMAPLPPQTSYQVLMVLKTLFREAESEGLVETRATTTIRSPKITVSPQKFLTWDLIKETEFGPRGRYTHHIRFLALHGLRWSEAAALTADDIHDGRVHITRSLAGPPKSAAGVRSVPYLGYFTPFSRDRRVLARALAPHEVTIHSLRKTYAYILKSSGVHVTTAQRLMGHASATVTLGIYTRVLDDEIDRAGDLILQNFPTTAA